MLRIALRYEGRESPAVPVQLDTGSDRCMFDHELPMWLGLNVYRDGALATATGIGGAEPIALFPIEVVFPDLGGLSWELTAQFKSLPGSMNGVLGHAGFLGRMRASFYRGDTFELSDIQRK